MAFRPGDVIGLIWSHPIVSVVVLLLFTPPLFPIVVYFSPLLISTALFVLAMVSMGSDMNETSSAYLSSSSMGDVPYKRGWIEDISMEEDGPELVDGERVSKRLKSSSALVPAKDEDSSWLGRVKNWEGTGRAWVESVLNQESRKSFAGADDGGTVVTREPPPVDMDAKEEFSAEGKNLDTSAEAGADDSGGISEVVEDDRAGKEEKKNGVRADDSGPNSAVEEALKGIDGDADRLGSATVMEKESALDVHVSSSEIGPAVDSDGDGLHGPTVPGLPPPSPLFRPRSGVPKPDSSGTWSGGSAKASAGSGDVKGTSTKASPRSIDAGEERKKTPSVTSNSKSNGQNDRNVELLSAAGTDQSKEKGDDGRTSRAAPEIVPASDDEGVAATKYTVIPKVRSHETLPEKARTGSTSTEQNGSNGGKDVPGGEGRDGGPPKSKSAAELLAPLRHGQQETPSAAVALSEKLKVPLADIMSLLAGDDEKDAVPNEGTSAVKVSTSSETTTTQEGEWSSSDDDVPEPQKPGGSLVAEKKQE